MKSFKDETLEKKVGHEIYWCMTRDHGDDTLMIADSELQAMYLMADDIGCEPEEVDVTFVKDLKADLGIKQVPVGYVPDSILEACSAVIIPLNPSRIVYLDGHCCVEGILDFVNQELFKRKGFEIPSTSSTGDGASHGA